MPWSGPRRRQLFSQVKTTLHIKIYLGSKINSYFCYISEFANLWSVKSDQLCQMKVPTGCVYVRRSQVSTWAGAAKINCLSVYGNVI